VDLGSHVDELRKMLGGALVTTGSSLFRKQTLDLATGVSRSRVREFRTVYPPHCGSL